MKLMLDPRMVAGRTQRVVAAAVPLGLCASGVSQGRRCRPAIGVPLSHRVVRSAGDSCNAVWVEWIPCARLGARLVQALQLCFKVPLGWFSAAPR